MDGELQRTRSGLYPGTLGTLRRLATTEGWAGIQAGLSAAVVREATKNLFRMGAYEPILHRIHTDPGHPPLWKRIAAGACSGVVSAYVANPLDLIKTRLQAHGRGILLKQTAGAAAQPQMSTSFRSGWHSVVHSGRAVGLSPVQALWRGSHVNAVRSAFATGSNMPAYTLAKEHLLRRGFQDDPLLHMVCGFTSGIATCVANNPIDVLRSRLYNQPLNADGSGALYRGMLHAAGRILSAEGPLAFYKGFVAHCMRAAPHYILAFTFMEEIKRWLRILAPV